MAKPAFIYAFDNLGPEKFTELCGLLLGSRYKGFLLGGVGPDGGVDGELDEALGEWHPETLSALLNETIHPGQLVIFQFKHKVTGRVGQANTRAELLNLYKCSNKKVCELHRELLLTRQPTAYVLVTNVEVNSQFRSKFIEQCRSENPSIVHYQIIGLDELETWITMELQLRHLYFPTIFGPPRFGLQLEIKRIYRHSEYNESPVKNTEPSEDLFQVSILNVGTVPSYTNLTLIRFNFLIDGRIDSFILNFKDSDKKLKELNPKPNIGLEPGRRHDYYFRFASLTRIKKWGTDILPLEVLVRDEIGNVYSEFIPEAVGNRMIEYIKGKIN